MITSNEPGLYLTDKYGIRCENLIVTEPHCETEFGKFYDFKVMTLFPFDRSLFELDIMTPEEIKWVDDYHEMVRTRLTPYLNAEEAAWMAEKTQPLKKD